MVGGGESIFYSLPLMLFGDDWLPLRSLWKPGDPVKINPPPSQGKIYELSLFCSPFLFYSLYTENSFVLLYNVSVQRQSNEKKKENWLNFSREII